MQIFLGLRPTEALVRVVRDLDDEDAAGLSALAFDPETFAPASTRPQAAQNSNATINNLPVESATNTLDNVIDVHISRLRSKIDKGFDRPMLQTVRGAADHFNALGLTGAQKTIGEGALREIGSRLTFLLNVGLDYLTLDRSGPTLSGSEAQRIRLASQLGSELSGVMYVLDEPSIGLHQRDNDRLIAALVRLRDLGNTVLVVEQIEHASFALLDYLARLLAMNEHMNLTAIKDPVEVWERHALDALTLVPLLAELGKGARLVDVGSGGGLPGMRSMSMAGSCWGLRLPSRWACRPASRAIARAVMAMIGSVRKRSPPVRLPRARMRRLASRPSITGMWMSISTAS